METLRSLDGRRSRKPIIQCDPKVGELRSVTDLVRLYWSNLTPPQVYALLTIRPTRERLLWYIHARSPEAEETLRSFLRGKGLLKSAKQDRELERRTSFTINTRTRGNRTSHHTMLRPISRCRGVNAGA